MICCEPGSAWGWILKAGHPSHQLSRLRDTFGARVMDYSGTLVLIQGMPVAFFHSIMQLSTSDENYS